MKIKGFLPIFPGFHGTIFEPDVEPFIEDGKIYDDYEWDYEEYCDRVARKCVEVIGRELEGFGVSIAFEKINSPKYYNHSNDSIYVTYDVTNSRFKELVKYTEVWDEIFQDYLEGNYKSRLGFSSYYSYDPEEWRKALKDKGDDLGHRFSALLEFILDNEGFCQDDLHSHLVGEMYI